MLLEAIRRVSDTIWELPTSYKEGKHPGSWALKVEARGEPLDPKRHDQVVDVKAVTLHEFRLEKTEDGWRTHVVLDI